MVCRLLAVCAMCFLPLFAVAEEAAAVSLFDGESLNGWEGDPQQWRVQGGSIVGEIGKGETLRKNTWLVWRGGELADFDLRLKVKLTGLPAANSGIQFRCQVENVDHVSGYQADLDMGAVWLGRIYDEHGRALLVERGTRVRIDEAGKRGIEEFANAKYYAVLFRENDWNDYRIVAIGPHVAVYVNGTLFSELHDTQKDQHDLKGSLAFQLHSGPETKVEFRDIQLEVLEPDDGRLDGLPLAKASSATAKLVEPEAASEEAGNVPVGVDGKPLNLGFESGDLTNWTATGDAFKGQPVKQDGISQRWGGQSSNKNGQFFIGGYEIVQDAGVGTLTSQPFTVTHPYASFLVAGGNSNATRVDVVAIKDGNETVISTSVGQQREQMERAIVDLVKYQGQQIAVRIVDESKGGWGHLNFDDFRFHETKPKGTVARTNPERSTFNPLLAHLRPNANTMVNRTDGVDTLAEMFVPEGFSVDLIANEPDLHQPMAFTFDAKGRIWVVEGHCYPQKRPDGEGLDRVLIIADEDHDGSFETRKVFCEGLNLVSGMQVGHGGVWIGAAPELLFIPDLDGDGVPDSDPVVLLDGFGYGDTHETINSLVWGPDGWLYGNQGVFNTSHVGKPGAAGGERVTLRAGIWRYHPTRHEFDVFAHGGSNQWGLAFDEHGQLFMTHCRSFWGKGSTTHVIQGGHFWNQVNGNYAPYISSTGVAGLSGFPNYLLASARYGHGEGGAGKRGSRAVYGGHSHVGTMIYLGDNWPSEYRNHLFTHNLHGHQTNHQINQRELGGYNTVHAGYDTFLCADPQFVGVDLQYGPDGAVYMTDWYDPRHCHNPGIENWDRSNGRIYRMKYDEGYEPVDVDYAKATDLELAEAQRHSNDWHVQAARLELARRASAGRIADDAIGLLSQIAGNGQSPALRLRGLWALTAIGRFTADVAGKAIDDESEYVRAWAIQLIADELSDEQAAALLRPLVASEQSLFVKRYLASAAQRLPAPLAWDVIHTLSRDAVNGTDRELPSLIWFAAARLMPENLNRALLIADQTPIESLRNSVLWYSAKLSDTGRSAVMSRFDSANDGQQAQLLQLLEAGVRGQSGLAQPEGWSNVSATLYSHNNGATRRAAESVGAVFRDPALFESLRGTLASTSDVNTLRHALTLLSADNSPINLPHYLRLLDNPALVEQIIPLLGRYNDSSIASTLIDRLSGWDVKPTELAMQALTSRVSNANVLLDAIESGQLQKQQLTAFYARKVSQLGDEKLNERLNSIWGRLTQSSAERKAEIDALVKAYSQAPLWAFNAGAGAAHFKKNCAACHQSGPGFDRIAPKLEGSGSKGIGYLVENVLDPNAVIGNDFQARIILTTEGRVITGLITEETDSAITVKTSTDTEIVPRDSIEEISISKNSFMPEGLLKQMSDREKIELFKYLMSL